MDAVTDESMAQAGSQPVDLAGIGRGLATRLRDLRATLARYDGFVIGPGQPGPGQREQGQTAAEQVPAQPDGEDGLGAARWLVLAALRAMADPHGWELLTRLRGADAGTRQLADALARPRVVVWDQVNDLVQAGLLARSHDLDVVGLTRAGQGLVDLVERLAAEAVAAS